MKSKLLLLKSSYFSHLLNILSLSRKKTKSVDWRRGCRTAIMDHIKPYHFMVGWYPGEPNEDSERCIEMQCLWDFQGKWNDGRCSYEQMHVCEFSMSKRQNMIVGNNECRYTLFK